MNTSLIQTYDRQNYLKVLLTFDEQILSAQKNITSYYSRLTQFKKSLSTVHNIVICGMGGSAIAGDFVRGIFAETLAIPIIINRDYLLPAYANENTLVILSSYSGNTEETVSAFQDALRRKTKLLTVATGGTIAEISKKHDLLHVTIPEGFQPRQAIGYSLVTLFRIIEHLFFDQHNDTVLNSSLTWIKKKQSQWSPGAENELWNLAKRLHANPVIVYASEKMFPAAVRLKGQISENAKLLAFANTVPEMNHNEIVGWDGIKTDAPFSVVLIRDDDDHPQIQKRFEILKNILSKKVPVYEMHSEGKEPVEKFLSLIYRGDWVSFFMAILRKTDPTPVDIITHFKNELSK